jgi:hypothetical protein
MDIRFEGPVRDSFAVRRGAIIGPGLGGRVRRGTSEGISRLFN